MRKVQRQGLQDQGALKKQLRGLFNNPKDLLDFVYAPMVIEPSGNGERAYDIYSRLLKDRIIFINGGITSEVATSVIAQLLFLQLESSKDTINMYIMSPGGSVSAAMAMYDVMQNIEPPVATYCIGEACSAAAFLLLSGAKGERYALPSSRIMIHQPWGGAEGSASDIAIQAAEVQRVKDQLYRRMAFHTGKDIKVITRDCDRDFFMDAEQAKEYGIIDHIKMPKKKTLK